MLGCNTKRTMQFAQGLYEGVEIGGDTTGLITYMRTDGITMVPEALNDARDVIASKYGKKYVPGTARTCRAQAAASGCDCCWGAASPSGCGYRPSACRGCCSRSS